MDEILEKNKLDRKFSFLVMWLWKYADSAILSEQTRISEMVRAKAKQTRFWDHPRESNVFVKKKMLVLLACDYSVISIVLLVAITRSKHSVHGHWFNFNFFKFWLFFLFPSGLPTQFLSTHEERGDIAVDFSVRQSVPFLVKVF